MITNGSRRTEPAKNTAPGLAPLVDAVVVCSHEVFADPDPHGTAPTPDVDLQASAFREAMELVLREQGAPGSPPTPSSPGPGRPRPPR